MMRFIHLGLINLFKHDKLFILNINYSINKFKCIRYVQQHDLLI